MKLQALNHCLGSQTTAGQLLSTASAQHLGTGAKKQRQRRELSVNLPSPMH